MCEGATSCSWRVVSHPIANAIHTTLHVDYRQWRPITLTPVSNGGQIKVNSTDQMNEKRICLQLHGRWRSENMQLCCLTSENHLKMFECVGASRGCAGAPARFLLTLFIFGNVIKMMTRAKVVPPPSSMTSTFKQFSSTGAPKRSSGPDDISHG